MVPTDKRHSHSGQGSLFCFVTVDLLSCDSAENVPTASLCVSFCSSSTGCCMVQGIDPWLRRGGGGNTVDALASKKEDKQETRDSGPHT